MDFDELLTSAARLSIMSALISNKALTFTELKRASGLADGNLHVQTRKLAAAGYLEINKGSRGRRSYTSFRVSELGVAALKLHVRKLQNILDQEFADISAKPGQSHDDDAQVWS